MKNAFGIMNSLTNSDGKLQFWFVCLLKKQLKVNIYLNI